MSESRPPAIPQSSPGSEYRDHRIEIDEAIARVLDSGWYILGHEVEAFEEEFARYLGLRETVGVANGTDALELALRAIGVGPGDAVFTVSHTAVATVAAIERAGAVPVLLDVDETTFTMDPRRLEDALAVAPRSAGARPKAVLVVHLYGHPAAMPAIVELARRDGLLVVEDCAQAHGARLGGRMVGTFGDVATFSFYPTKNLGALGDGGLVASDNAGVTSRLRQLRQYGWRERYISATTGFNSRLDELQAAVLRVKLRHLDAGNERRRALASRYDSALSSATVRTPSVAAGAEHVYHQYVIRVSRRTELMAWLRDRGIATAIHYPVPVHLQPAYAGRLPLPRPLEVTERLASEIVSLPMFVGLADADADRVAHAVLDWERAATGSSGAS
jgi:dTDP-4-amino-4,6-dideoxygalactose transaminase